MRVVDCATPLTGVTAPKIHKDGVDGVCRYLGWLRFRTWKSLSPTEAQTIVKSGLVLVSVLEKNPTHDAYFTYEQGVKDGQDAVAEAKYVGQPEGTAIYFTVDYDAQPEIFYAIRSYFRGVRSAIGGYKVGAYAGYAVLKFLQTCTGLVDYYWQTYAWSYSRILPGIHMLQQKNSVTEQGVNVDIDEIFANPGSWPKTEEEEQVKTIAVTVNGKSVPAFVGPDGQTYILYNGLSNVGKLGEHHRTDGGWDFTVETPPVAQTINTSITVSMNSLDPKAVADTLRKAADKLTNGRA